MSESRRRSSWPRGGVGSWSPNTHRITPTGRFAALLSLLLTTLAAGTVLTLTASTTVVIAACALATVVLFISGSAPDDVGRRRFAAFGLLAVPAAVVCLASLAEAAPPQAEYLVVASLASAGGWALSAPALIALVGTGTDPIRPVTPRMRVALGVGSPWPTGARKAEGVVRPFALAAGGLTAVAALISPAAGGVGAVLAVGVVIVGVCVLFQRVSADRAAEAAARILFPLVAGGLFGAILSATSPVWVGGATVGAIAIASGVIPLALRVRSSVAHVQAGSWQYRRIVRGFARAAKPRPSVAIHAATVEDVQAAIRDASASGRTVVANSTGHGAVSLPDLSGSILVRARINEPVTVDVSARTARIPAGAAWGDVVAQLAPTGLMAPHGSSPLVGAIGYLLRGGLSFYGRSAGLAANSIVSVELVTADGEVLTVDRDHHPDLFWAVRGGGGVGVVTALTVRLFPVPALATGIAFWTADAAPDLLAAWVRWAADAPREATTTFRVMRLPRVPGIPRAIGGRPMIAIDGVIHSRADRGASERVEHVLEELLTPLQRIATPTLQTWRAASVFDVPWTHIDPALALNTVADHQILTDLDPQGQSAYLDLALAPNVPLSTIELRQLGAAFAERPDDAGVLGHLPGSFSFFATGLVTRNARAPYIERALDGFREVLQPYSTGYTIPNYAENRERPQRTFDDDVAANVQRVRAMYDPHGLFRADLLPGAQGTRREGR